MCVDVWESLTWLQCGKLVHLISMLFPTLFLPHSPPSPSTKEVLRYHKLVRQSESLDNLQCSFLTMSQNEKSILRISFPLFSFFCVVLLLLLLLFTALFNCSGCYSSLYQMNIDTKNYNTTTKNMELFCFCFFIIHVTIRAKWHIMVRFLLVQNVWTIKNKAISNPIFYLMIVWCQLWHSF